MYGPAGKAQAERRQRQLDLLDEIRAWGDTPQLVIGDFNEPLPSSLLAGELIPRGWRIPLHGGATPKVTFRSGSVLSWLDSAIMSPKFDSSCQYLDVWWPLPTQHAILTGSLRVDPTETYQQVCYPSRVLPGVPTNHTPVDWEQVGAQICALRDDLSQQDTLWHQQSALDEAWQLFERALHKHLHACHRVGEAKNTRGCALGAQS